uniref:Arrestin-like N-terminal domain-containing protein n=1 Tax=Kryptolebias marmoratus TaxID=37003 RepID=A0A3Q3BJH7_KRYMA
MVLGKVRTLAVYFDSLNENNLPVFSGADLVSGRVVVDVRGDLRVKRLDITARGVAKVRWTESRNAGANTAYTQNYMEELEYLHHYDTLIGEETAVRTGSKRPMAGKRRPMKRMRRPMKKLRRPVRKMRRQE